MMAYAIGETKAVYNLLFAGAVFEDNKDEAIRQLNNLCTEMSAPFEASKNDLDISWNELDNYLPNVLESFIGKNSECPIEA